MPLLLAMDPGLADFGAVLLDRQGRIVAADVMTTAPNSIPRKRPVAPPRDPSKPRRRTKRPVVGGVAIDTDRRIDELLTWLYTFARCGERQHGAAILAAVAESPGGSLLGFTAAIALGTASTCAKALCRELGIPLERVAVQAWRRTLVPGVKKIPDADLYRAIGARTGFEVAAQLNARCRSSHTKSVHALDAVGIGRWALNYSPTVRRALGIDHGGL